ncbi:helix-turn-helix transcriptional regulator [Allomeiothermus silvanus]|uniref:helix-turn-helix transcriptional regulator n=1 Tax=Allomeiothermus silvanus TaxID=52022 RepID=UPI0023F2FC0F|nr:helix-turn-helix transcriptional regulator [Allomeiothermus silvanus]
MDALALYRRGRYWEALALAQQRGELKSAALALLALGKVAEAQTILETWQPQESVAEAERLSLLGFAAFRRGDPLTYRRLALAAAQAAQTPLTLYHLGLSLPPKDGLLALQEAFNQLQAQGAPAEERARLSFALARTFRRLGRLAEALSYASLAALHDPQPSYRLEELTLLAYAGEEPLAALERSLPPLLAHEAPSVRYYALWLSLLLQGMHGQANSDLLEALLEHTQGSLLAYDLPLWVRLFKGHPSQQTLLARLLRAAKAQPSDQALPQALLLLAEGLYRYPQPEARILLEDGLLPCERAVLRRLVFGLENAEIARELGVSRRTVENRVGALREKLGLRGRVELALYYLGMHPRLWGAGRYLRVLALTPLALEVLLFGGPGLRRAPRHGAPGNFPAHQGAGEAQAGKQPPDQGEHGVLFDLQCTAGG